MWGGQLFAVTNEKYYLEEGSQAPSQKTLPNGSLPLNVQEWSGKLSKREWSITKVMNNFKIYNEDTNGYGKYGSCFRIKTHLKPMVDQLMGYSLKDKKI